MGATTTQGTGGGSVTAVKPPIYNGVVKAENIIVDALQDYRVDIESTGKITSDGNLMTHGSLTVDGTSHLTGNLTVSAGNAAVSAGNITASGYIRGGAAGQLLNSQIFTYTGNATINSNVEALVRAVSYTPVSSNSQIFVEFDATYAIDGSSDDGFRSNIRVDGTEITWRDQLFSDANGGGTRSSVLFPIAGVFANNSLTSKTIAVKCKQNTSDDNCVVNLTSSILRISEYAA